MDMDSRALCAGAKGTPQLKAHFSLWLIGFALWGCSSPEPATPPAADTAPVQVTSDYHTVQTQAGQVQWELWGETATRYAQDPLLHLDGVRMRFYEAGELEAELNSQAGEIDESTYNTTAFGRVRVVTVDGKELRSEVLHWSNAEEIIHSEAFVEFTENDQILSGYGLRTDPNLSDLTLRERVVGSAPPDSSPDSTGSEKE
jgi:LPS export ABC transporter protein LptC